MSMRKLSAKWHRKSFGKISFTMTLIRNVAPTHAIVCFHADGSTSVVPTKQLTTTPPDRSPKPGDICDVLWNDKNTYTATVRAIGSQKEMESMMDVGSSSDENVDDEDDDTDDEDGDEKEILPARVQSLILPQKRKKSEASSGTKSSAQKKEIEKMNAAMMKLVETENDNANFRSEVQAQFALVHKRMLRVIKMLKKQDTVKQCEQVDQDNESSKHSVTSENSNKKIVQGCWLGDPAKEGKRVWIEGGDAVRVHSAEYMSKEASKLALNLLRVWNCLRIIHGIRLHINYLYPCNEESARWKAILITTLNAKCRAMRKKLKRCKSLDPGKKAWALRWMKMVQLMVLSWSRRHSEPNDVNLHLPVTVFV
eukprot:Em0001g3070a